ncbi:MAG: hypothetical protein R3C60_09295 [Parvularculaceae bacterium]
MAADAREAGVFFQLSTPAVQAISRESAPERVSLFDGCRSAFKVPQRRRRLFGSANGKTIRADSSANFSFWRVISILQLTTAIV